MCLLIFAHQVSARYPLLVAANRDEFHARPTAASEFWTAHPQLLAGRDLEQGGTWMGTTRDGRFAAVTNFRDPARTAPAPRSRGELPLQFLLGEQTPREYLTEIAGLAGEYAGFNLLLGTPEQLWYFSNSPRGREHPAWPLQPGIYGLSNALLDTPWPKVALGKTRLTRMLEAGGLNTDSPGHDSLSHDSLSHDSLSHDSLSHESLAGVVTDRHRADPEALNLQGQDSSMEQLLSAQFIVSPGYGTRSTTTLWYHHEQGISWREQSFDARGAPTTVVEREFRRQGHAAGGAN